MPYIDSNGNIVEARQSAFHFLWQMFAFVLYFFRTLFAPLVGETGMHSFGDGSSRHGPGGPRRGDYGGHPGQRPIGRPTFSSGMSCPPLGGGS